MGYQLKFNCLLVAPEGVLPLDALEAGKRYSLEKEGERLYPLNIAIELSDAAYRYVAKVAVRKLTLERNKTSLEIEVLKVFTPEEAAVFTQNFIKPER